MIFPRGMVDKGLTLQDWELGARDRLSQACHILNSNGPGDWTLEQELTGTRIYLASNGLPDNQDHVRMEVAFFGNQEPISFWLRLGDVCIQQTTKSGPERDFTIFNSYHEAIVEQLEANATAQG